MIRSASSLETLVHYYLANISSLHSYNSIRKAFGLNVETARNYTRFLQEAFLIFELNRYHPNLKVQSRDPKKIYAIDTGLRNANAATGSEDIGKLAENIVYLELRRRNCELTYFKNTQEVDFVITKFGKPKSAIQVCYADIRKESETREREITALVECLQATQLPTGWILTQKGEEKIHVEKKEIHLIPLYKWLMG